MTITVQGWEIFLWACMSGFGCVIGWRVGSALMDFWDALGKSIINR